MTHSDFYYKLYTIFIFYLQLCGSAKVGDPCVYDNWWNTIWPVKTAFEKGGNILTSSLFLAALDEWNTTLRTNPLRNICDGQLSFMCGRVNTRDACVCNDVIGPPFTFTEDCGDCVAGEGDLCSRNGDIAKCQKGLICVSNLRGADGRFEHCVGNSTTSNGTTIKPPPTSNTTTSGNSEITTVKPTGEIIGGAIRLDNKKEFIQYIMFLILLLLSSHL